MDCGFPLPCGLPPSKTNEKAPGYQLGVAGYQGSVPAGPNQYAPQPAYGKPAAKYS